MTENEWKLISDLKRKLIETDYIVLKYVEGLIDEEHWQVIKQDRANWRAQIKELEKKI